MVMETNTVGIRRARIYPGRGRSDARVSPQALVAVCSAQRFPKDPIDDTNDTNHIQFLAWIRLRPKPMFGQLPSL